MWQFLLPNYTNICFLFLTGVLLPKKFDLDLLVISLQYLPSINSNRKTRFHWNYPHVYVPHPFSNSWFGYHLQFDLPENNLLQMLSNQHLRKHHADRLARLKLRSSHQPTSPLSQYLFPNLGKGSCTLSQCSYTVRPEGVISYTPMMSVPTHTGDLTETAQSGINSRSRDYAISTFN